MKGRKLPVSGTTRTRRSGSTDATSNQSQSQPQHKTRQASPSETLPPEGKLLSQEDDGERRSKSIGRTRAEGLSRQRAIKTRKMSAATASTSDGTGESDSMDVSSSKSRGQKRPRVVTRHSSTETRRAAAKRPHSESNGSHFEDLIHETKSSDVTSEIKTGFSTDPPLLLAEEKGHERLTMVRILIEGSHFVPSRSPSRTHSASFLGHDGNQYWCQVCREFGDVVCCDGCPRVYHKDCIPIHTAARKSLDKDQDPWYCPECLKDRAGSRDSGLSSSNLETEIKSLPQPERRSVRQNRGVDSQGSSDEVLEKSVGSEINNGVTKGPSSAYTSKTTSFSAGKTKEDGQGQASTTEQGSTSALKTRRASADFGGTNTRSTRGVKEAGGAGSDDENGNQYNEEFNEDFEEKATDGDDGRKARKRSRQDSLASEKSPDVLKKKKKKKKSKKTKENEDFVAKAGMSFDEDDDDYVPAASGVKSDIVRAIPAFFFYLAENRWKIERVLARKHRTFNRLPKGRERNELVAKEAALWWVKLRPVDHRRYMTMSMRDFESRIIEWKEDKNLREMLSGEQNDELDDDNTDLPELEDDVEADLTERPFRHRASVGAKSLRKTPGDKYNFVLEDLLRDDYFTSSSRSNYEGRVAGESTIAGSLSEALGPIATSLGDECLGCSRGWKHYCHVLKKVLPPVKRLKNPPFSSISATRIGLGMRVRLEKDIAEESSEGNIDKPLLAWRATEDANLMGSTPVIPSSHLSQPSRRYDGVAAFVEEVALMKAGQTRADGVLNGSEEKQIFKCNGCGLLLASAVECIPCRRGRILSSITKRQTKDQEHLTGDEKLLHLYTVMLACMGATLRRSPSVCSGDKPTSATSRSWASPYVLTAHPSYVPGQPRNLSQSGMDPIDSEEEKEDEGSESVGKAPNVEAERTSSSDLGHSYGSSQTPITAQTQERARIRNPPTRLLVSSTSNKDYNSNGSDRQREKVRNGRVLAFERRCTSTACYGILLSIMRRDMVNIMSSSSFWNNADKSMGNSRGLERVRETVLKEDFESIDAFLVQIRAFCNNVITACPKESEEIQRVNEILDMTGPLRARAMTWLNLLLATYTKILTAKDSGKHDESLEEAVDDEKILEEMRELLPEAMDVLEDAPTLRSLLETALPRTQENEQAYYGSLAIERSAKASSAALAPYMDSKQEYATVAERDSNSDEELRLIVDTAASAASRLVKHSRVPDWREAALLRILGKVKGRREEQQLLLESGCTRCHPLAHTRETNGDYVKSKSFPWAGNEKTDSSRKHLSTGLASAQVCFKIVNKRETDEEKTDGSETESCVSVRPSKIHGLGLFADQHFKGGDTVAEYVGEVLLDEKIIDSKCGKGGLANSFVFRIDDQSAIDATRKGGAARFLNHSCFPNCVVNFKKGAASAFHRIFIEARYDIRIHEEVTIDYDVTADLDARTPCNCGADECRGYLNRKCPEEHV